MLDVCSLSPLRPYHPRIPRRCPMRSAACRSSKIISANLPHMHISVSASSSPSLPTSPNFSLQQQYIMERHPKARGEGELTDDDPQVHKPRRCLFKNTVVTAAAVASAPVVAPPVLLFSALGLALAFPFGLFLAGFACTDKIMSSLLSPPRPPQEAKIFQELESEQGSNGYWQEIIDSTKPASGIRSIEIEGEPAVEAAVSAAQDKDAEENKEEKVAETGKTKKKSKSKKSSASRKADIARSRE